eukprot:CAMPEP_0206125516 /NCGR_PEP_ID=MMETSP1472-20131121/17591_1 /ASSEMBLY_ACC=CAM_ASM_001108 /TAXON_ID=41880 /ORGANISM="Pycnococcus provasolii, Strain RCC251" /LENGTH=335 /DNA_ID=CAMNT_0053516437 /DNA_START=19 /DNA_END=1022 /DNA_ORIENTATION=+
MVLRVSKVCCGLHHVVLLVSEEESSSSSSSASSSPSSASSLKPTSSSVACLGWNEHGQCDVPRELRVRCGSGGSAANTSIAAGDRHSLAIITDGERSTIHVWGQDNFQQCSSVPAPLDTESDDRRRKYVMIDAGQFHSVVLDSEGEVTCWGGNNFGQCDVPETLGPCVAVAAGGDFTVALRRDDGALFAWGANRQGQAPGKVQPPSRVVAVAAGAFFGAALCADCADNRIFTWGDNALHDSLDVGDDDADTGGVVSAIACGTNHAVVALKRGGVVESGRVPETARLPDDVKLKCVSGTYNSSFGVDENGTLHVWRGEDPHISRSSLGAIGINAAV